MGLTCQRAVAWATVGVGLDANPMKFCVTAATPPDMVTVTREDLTARWTDRRSAGESERLVVSGGRLVSPNLSMATLSMITTIAGSSPDENGEGYAETFPCLDLSSGPMIVV